METCIRNKTGTGTGFIDSVPVPICLFIMDMLFAVHFCGTWTAAAASAASGASFAAFLIFVELVQCEAEKPEYK